MSSYLAKSRRVEESEPTQDVFQVPLSALAGILKDVPQEEWDAFTDEMKREEERRMRELGLDGTQDVFQPEYVLTEGGGRVEPGHAMAVEPDGVSVDVGGGDGVGGEPESPGRIAVLEQNLEISQATLGTVQEIRWKLEDENTALKAEVERLQGVVNKWGESSVELSDEVNEQLNGYCLKTGRFRQDVVEKAIRDMLRKR